MNKQKLLVSLSAVSLIIAFSLIAWMYKSNQQEKAIATIKRESSVLERDYSPTLGPDNAKVTLVEFLDPECESCRMFYPFVKEILKENKDQVRLVVRYALYHGNSQFVATMLEAIRKQGKYWEAMELFFEKQPTWGSHHAPKPELLWDYAASLNLDMDKLKEDMRDQSIYNNLVQDTEDGKTLGVRQTPSFFINGEPLKEFGYEQLKSAIKSKL